MVLGLALTWALYARSVGILTDFWFDEVWSLRLAHKLQSPWQVFTALHHDNNHYLNTLWLYLLGDRTDWPLYRLPAALTGLGTIIVLARIGFRRGVVQGLAAGLMGATSYLLLLYSTEARGYGPALFFAVLCVDFIQREQERPRLAWVIGFNVSAMLGLLSHMSFLFPYLGMLVWQVVGELRRTGLTRAAVQLLLRFHLLTLVLGGVLYFVDLRHLHYGGGAPFAPWEMALHTLGYTYGWPPGRFRLWVLLALTLMGAAYVFWRLTRERDAKRWFYLVGIVLAPTAIIVATHPQFFFPRYFLSCVPVLLLLLADLFGYLWESRPGRVVTILALMLICTSNVALSVQFFRDGRGHYLEALTEMARDTEGPEISIGTNYDSHLNLMAEYYVPQVESPKRFSYVPRDHFTATSPEWLVLEYYDTSTADPRIRTESGAVYEWVRDYPFSARLSGAGWRLFRRVAREGASGSRK